MAKNNQARVLRSNSSTLKASFLHDDDWDPTEEFATPHLDDINHEPILSASASDELEEGSLYSEESSGLYNGTQLQSGHTAGTKSTVDASAHAIIPRGGRISYNRANTRTSTGDLEDSDTSASVPYFGSAGDFSSHSSDNDTTSNSNSSANGSDDYLRWKGGFSKRISSRTSIDPNAEETELPLHQLAANVATKVKGRFEKNLPDALQPDYESRDTIGPYKTTEIVLGPKLGSGEFSHVYEIKGFKPRGEVEEKLNEEGRNNEVDVRKRMKSRERYHDTKKACYAVKHLRPELVEEYDREEYVQAASDLALEAEFLGGLQHPNIIKLRGISFDGAAGFAQGPKGYFLIIDRLNETLDMRIKQWHKSKHSRRGRAKGWKARMLQRPAAKAVGGAVGVVGGAVGGVMVGKPKRSQSDVGEFGGEGGGNGSEHHAAAANGGGGGAAAPEERISAISEEQVDVGLQISSALMYLHERGIMFRDLKPQNIGFDVRGDVKLFDFGLATVMPPFGDPYEDKFNMSGAGSPRYMAPEVLIDPPEDYNLKADVYTFGIVLWEMFSLEVPYSDIKRREDLVKFVVEEEGRPTINENWPEPIKEALKQSFDVKIANRPSIQLFYNLLRLQLLQQRDGDDTMLGNAFIKRRRSFSSLRDLDVDLGDDDDGDGQQHPQIHEKFPQRMKERILNHVKPQPTTSQPTPNGVSPTPLRRRRNKLREKFRLSVKHEARHEE